MDNELAEIFDAHLEDEDEDAGLIAELAGQLQSAIVVLLTLRLFVKDREIREAISGFVNDSRAVIKKAERA